MIGWLTICTRSTYVWVLVAGFLVMFMQAGFMLVETGLCRAKNAAHTAAMNSDDLPAGLSRLLGLRLCHRLGQLVERPGTSGLVSVARSRPFGAERRLGLGAAVDAAGKATGAFTYGLIGLKGWFLTGAVGDTAVMVLFFFMMVFMDTTATIPTGAMAERWAWKNFCSLWPVGRAAVLSLCELGLGWRLARSGRHQLGPGSWSSRFCRLGCRARDGRRHRARGGHGHRPAHRQVRFAR